MRTTLPARRTTRGVSLIESIIALLVVGFGLAAIAGFQLSLWRNADVARQRSEATRLAQEAIEAWRAFEQVESETGKLAYNDLASGADTPVVASNTAYARSWAVTPGDGDLQRLVSVSVNWTDRAGDTALNTVTLQSIVSRSDPADVGSLAVPTVGNGQLRRTRDRSVQVPFEAIKLGGANQGRSALPWRGSSGGYLVFDDVSGAVVAQCGAAVNDSTDIAASCSALDGYILQGYVRGALPAGGLLPVFDRLQFLAAASTPECSVEHAIDQNTGATIAGAERYRCLMRPSDHDANAATPRVWSGRMSFAGVDSGNVVCRYTGAAATVVNAEHPDTYALVNSSLSQQNFFIGGSAGCAAGTVPVPAV
jgi:Tfp pilus assembly protein PilV